MWLGNCRSCHSSRGHSPFCQYAEQPVKCNDCGGTGNSTHQDGGPCVNCGGKGRVGGAREKWEAEVKKYLK